MTGPVRTVDEGSAIDAALVTMRGAAVRRLPVVDRKGALVGILTRDDVLDLLAEEVAQVGGVLGRQAPRRRRLGQSGA